KEEERRAVLGHPPQVLVALDHFVVKNQLAPPQHPGLHPAKTEEKEDPVESRLEGGRGLDRAALAGYLRIQPGDAKTGIRPWRHAGFERLRNNWHGDERCRGCPCG